MGMLENCKFYTTNHPEIYFPFTCIHYNIIQGTNQSHLYYSIIDKMSTMFLGMIVFMERGLVTRRIFREDEIVGSNPAALMAIPYLLIIVLCQTG